MAVSPEDILGFLKRLPDNSVSFISSGNDIIAAQHNPPELRKYLSEIAKEIERTLHPDGAYIEETRGSFLANPRGTQLKLDKLRLKIRGEYFARLRKAS